MPRATAPAPSRSFAKAYELYPAGLGSLRNTAECEESVGHFASSRRAWLDLKRALITVDDRKYDGWPRDATDAAARLAPKLATLTLEVSAVGAGGVGAPSDGVEVRLNSEVLAPGLLATPLERDPGALHHPRHGPRCECAPGARGPARRGGNSACGSSGDCVHSPEGPVPEPATATPTATPSTSTSTAAATATPTSTATATATPTSSESPPPPDDNHPRLHPPHPRMGSPLASEPPASSAPWSAWLFDSLHSSGLSSDHCSPGSGNGAWICNTLSQAIGG